MEATHASPRTRPSWLALSGWLVGGASLGLALMIFQPPLDVGLAVGLPLAAVGRAWGAAGRAPRSAYSMGAFGIGVLVLNLVLLGPILLSSDNDSGSGSDLAPTVAP